MNRRIDRQSAWRLKLRIAITSGKKRIDLQDRQEDRRAGIREARKRDVQRVTKDNGPDIVKGSTPSETEKETASRAGAGIVEAPPPPLEREREREREREKLWLKPN
jgi:hypothetical protein